MRNRTQQIAIPAAFMRGGTSKALVFDRRHLPADRADWAPLFLAALGSPDPNGRQLDGMGGGISSLSKICVVEPAADADADLDYTFAQVEVGRPEVDFTGNCGSMSAAIGPFAIEEGMLPPGPDGERTVRIRSTNTGMLIVARFPVRDGAPVVDGPQAVDGVAGTGAPIRLDFLTPGGGATGRLLPTGNLVDRVEVAGIGTVEYSYVDAGNPCMFIDAAKVGASGAELPAEIEAAPGMLERIEAIRQHVGVATGAAPDLAAAARVSTPRVALVARASEAPTLSGRHLAAGEADIMVRMIARGLPNRAVPVTTALCLALACRLPGTLPNRLLAAAHDGDEIRIAHPSGVWQLAAKVGATQEGYVAESASIFLTARRLFQGQVLVPRSRLSVP